MIHHLHHKIPRHMGGSDDPSNLVKLTIEEHAIAHKLLYEKYGKEEDRIAWLGLAGLAPHAEIFRMVVSNAQKGNKHWLGKKHKDSSIELMKGPKSEEHKKKMRGPRPHINQKGLNNNNAVAIITPMGKFDTISDCAKVIANDDNIPFKRALGRVWYKINTPKYTEWMRVI